MEYSDTNGNALRLCNTDLNLAQHMEKNTHDKSQFL